MEGTPSPKHPQIFVNRADTIRSEISEIKRTSPEPEVEECCEDAQLKSILDHLGIDYSELLRLKSVQHLEGEDPCPHCKLLGQISSLQDGISHLAQEISATEEILKLKKLQNGDFKGVIDKLHGNFGKVIEEEPAIEGTGKTCSCAHGCNVF